MLSAVILTGCGQFGLYTHSNGEVIASVGDKELYISDVQPLFHDGMTPQDSIQLVESYIENWIKSEVKTDAAQAALSGQEQQIEDLVEQYRSSLMTYRYENDIVNNQLDTMITSKQVDEYYAEHRDNFRLAGPVVKAAVVRLPSKRFNRKIADMFKKSGDKDWSEFQAICHKNGYRLDDYTMDWVDFSTVIAHLPFSSVNFDEFLRAKKYYEVEDDQYRYMLKIDGYRPTGDYSPSERETENIRKILLNSRRADLLRNLEDSLMKQAEMDNRIKIYRK